jgi:hypothetical protein
MGFSSIKTIHHGHEKKRKKKVREGKGKKRQCEPRPWRRMRRFSSVPSSLGV